MCCKRKVPSMLPVCPACDVGLFMLRFRGIEVDYCDRCRGLWLDAGELEALAGPDASARWNAMVTGDADARVRLCPRCDQPLERVQVEGLTLDRCRLGHGWWFDQGELPDLLASPIGEELREMFRTTNSTT